MKCLVLSIVIMFAFVLTPVEILSQRAKVKEPSLGFTPAQLRQRWNMHCAEFEQIKDDLMLGELQIEPGNETNTIEYRFAKDLSLTCWVNKSDGSVGNISVGGKPVTEREGTLIMMAWTLTVMATNPRLSLDEVSDVMRRLGATDDQADIVNGTRKVIVGRVKYQLSGLSWMGTYLAADPAQR